MFIAETRKRAQRLISARLVRPSRNLAQLGGGVGGHCPDGDDRGGSAFAGGVSGYFGVPDHLYQPIRGLGNRCWRSPKFTHTGLPPKKRGTLHYERISTIVNIAVEVPARTDRAAASASIASDLPLLRRERRSPRSRLNDSMPAALQVTG